LVTHHYVGLPLHYIHTLSVVRGCTTRFTQRGPLAALTSSHVTHVVHVAGACSSHDCTHTRYPPGCWTFYIYAVPLPFTLCPHYYRQPGYTTPCLPHCHTPPADCPTPHHTLVHHSCLIATLRSRCRHLPAFHADYSYPIVTHVYVVPHTQLPVQLVVSPHFLLLLLLHMTTTHDATFTPPRR